MTGRKPYRSDLSDAEWALIEPELTAWRAPRLARKVSSGSQPVHELREVVNAILYVNRTGMRVGVPSARPAAVQDGVRVLHRLA